MKTDFSKEIFILDEISGKPRVFQYHTEKMFDVMLKRFKHWEREGKLHIIDVRNSVYRTGVVA